MVIDGRMGEGEWDRAATQRLPDGTLIRLQQDGRHVFLGIAAAQQGFPSLCVAQGETVRILHASAALGSVTYKRSAQEWTTGDTEFVYGMRNTALTEEARAERSEYLSRHGWLASTYRMGEGRVYELQIPGRGPARASRGAGCPARGFRTAWRRAAAHTTACAGAVRRNHPGLRWRWGGRWSSFSWVGCPVG